ncbi:hypothetical protein EDD98_7563 [Streptomyces sp. PanSC19]|uniref:hypothetical protein n=1 Tax=Streptomyces sp. PanSC19 TaxID=1520455 RepID=UPI000FC332AD|nr:hypothetical protein [Streptomyces sp. PanSC19]ROQ23613.1 hypothetical protein EDD98_7563 [Streptomyces sp. PanSC19]
MPQKIPDFAELLGGAELTVCAQILQAADRTAFYAALADPVRHYLNQRHSPQNFDASL